MKKDNCFAADNCHGSWPDGRLRQPGSRRRKGTVYVYCFGDYFDPELEYQFEEETGYDVVIDLFDTNEEMYPVIKTILPSMM